MRRTIVNTLAISFCFILFSLGPAWAAKTAIGLTVSPKEVDINAFFSGKTLTVSGRIPAGDDVIVEIIGKDAKSAFDLMGQKGPFWMTQGSVTLEHVPELYLMLCPDRLAGDPDTGDKKISAQGIGMAHIEEQAKATGTVEVPKNVFDMFLALEKKSHLYNRVKGAVTYSDEQDGTKEFTAACHLPALIDTGQFKVVATTLDHGLVTDKTANTFEVKEVGFVKLVDHLASDQRLAYGVTAVVIALFAGLVMALVFKQDR